MRLSTPISCLALSFGQDAKQMLPAHWQPGRLTGWPAWPTSWRFSVSAKRTPPNRDSIEADIRYHYHSFYITSNGRDYCARRARRRSSAPAGDQRAPIRTGCAGRERWLERGRWLNCHGAFERGAWQLSHALPAHT